MNTDGHGTLVYGIRAVEALLRHRSDRIEKLWVADDEHGPRASLSALANSVGVSVQRISKRQLDNRLSGTRHQWIAAEVTPADYVDWLSYLNTKIHLSLRWIR